MKTVLSSKKTYVWVLSICSIALIMGLVAYSPAKSDDTTKKESEPVAKTVETPAADSFGVVTAASWEEAYPNEFKTYEENAANKPGADKHNYLECVPSSIFEQKLLFNLNRFVNMLLGVVTSAGYITIPQMVVLA